MGVPKPEKPSPDFPLFPHNRGKWAKKVGGKLRYFGRWDDPQGALEEWRRYEVEDKEERKANRGYDVGLACNEFLTMKHKALESGELSRAMFAEYRRTCAEIVRHLGRHTLIDELRPSHFEAMKDHWSPKMNLISLGNKINHTRIVFNWCYEAKRIKERVDFGPTFKKPSKKMLRRHKRE
jgi:hypothetical protein